MERVFDRKATFVGLPVVIESWDHQSGGKQSDMASRHLPSRMNRDANQPIVIVQRLAESVYRREYRGLDKTYKCVQFTEMAHLTVSLSMSMITTDLLSKPPAEVSKMMTLMPVSYDRFSAPTEALRRFRFLPLRQRIIDSAKLP